jgi:hypothetical protein
MNITDQINIGKSKISLEDSKWKIYKTFNEKQQTNNNYNFQENENINNKNIENVKFSLFSKINKNSSQLQIITEKYKYVKKENAYLRKVIKDKDKIISDFAILFQQFKEKFKKFEEINQMLKAKLLNKYRNEKEENKNFLDNNYNIKLKEKDEMLEKMNEELIYMHNEYKNLTNNLEKINNCIHDVDYIELKNKINELSKENNYLMKQNEKREKRIIDLIKKNDNEENDNINFNTNDDLLVTFKNQENEYIKTINMLQNRVIEKDKEIQMIKEEFKNILND